MNVQAVKDWMKAIPKEEGDSFIFLLASGEDFACKVDGDFGVVVAMLLTMGNRNPDFAGAVILAAAKLAVYTAEGGAE